MSPVAADDLTGDTIFGKPAEPRTTFDRLPGGGYVFAYPEQDVRVELRYLRREHGHLIAEVDVRCSWPGALRYQGSLSCADLNLSSQTTRKSLGKYCAERARSEPEDFDWIGAIDTACRLTIQAEREGEAVIVLDDAPPVTERDVDVYGLRVPIDAPSLLYAHGGTLKSLIALLVLGELALQGEPVLLCDWEWTADRHRQRKRRLFGDDRIETLHYRKCRAPLTVEVDSIRRFCEARGIQFLVVDSIAQACDGKLSDDDVALRFFRALGTLPPALCAAHVAKGTLGADAKGEALPFGSVYFHNLCRASWMVRKQETATDDLVTVGLYPQKQNDGERLRPVGLEFAFTNPSRIGVRPVELAGIEGLADKLPLATRMAYALRRGPLTVVQLAEALDAKADTISRTVRRSRQTFTTVPGRDDHVTRIALVERRA